jgi:mycothiol synthase
MVAGATAPFAVRRLDPDDEAGLSAYVRIRSEVTPDNPTSLAESRWEDATYPAEIARFLAEGADGVPLGAATTGRIWMHDASYERYWLGVWVLPWARRRGVGSALLAAAGASARAAGKTGFQTELSEAQTEGHAWLARRSFRITDRAKSVRLVLADLAAPDPAPPPGIALVALADRPDLLPGVYRVAQETFPDIPSGDEPVSVGTIEEFAARDVDRAAIPKDAFLVALDATTGEAVGFASLIFIPGSTTVAYHDMTAVLRAYRGRGIARALKRGVIAWAIDHGLEALETANDERNAPMRAVNAALGYRPIPDSLGLQGPLPPPG